MAKAKRLPSGNYRALVYDRTETGPDGKKHRIYESFTSPDRAEAEFMAAEFARSKKRRKSPGNMTVGEAVDKYIAKKDGVLSPTTIAGYQSIRDHRFPDLMDVKLKDLNKELLEQAVNSEAKRPSHRGGTLSAKTISNAYMLLVTVLNDYHHSLDTSVTLPAPDNTALKELLPPKIIFDVVKGTAIELPVLLAMWLSFSLSEIRGLTKEKSVKDGYLTIWEVVVDVDGKPLRKAKGKQKLRQRKLKMPAYIQSLIDALPPQQNELVTLTGHAIYMRWKRLLEANGLPHMSFHDLRHVNASVMAELGIPDKYAQERGGWKSDKVMKQVYQHTFSKTRQEVDQRIDTYFEQNLSSPAPPPPAAVGPRRLKIKRRVSKPIQHEMQHKEKETSV